MQGATQIVVWLNALASALGRLCLAPVAVMPGWLSATVIAAVTGVLMLIVFKYTSHQRAIKYVRSQIKADLLSLSLFKDNVGVSLRAQGRILLGAAKLLVLAVVPMLVMIVPMGLLLGQLAAWYQVRPLRVGEETVVTLQLNGDADAPWPEVALQAGPAMTTTIGPVRALSERMVCWNIAAQQTGYHRLVFDVGGQPVEKELAVGDGFMCVSPQRPAWNWEDVLLFPLERPFPPDSSVRRIEIDYPARSAWTCGSNSWLGYWFIASMVSALAFRRVLNVNL